MTPEEQQQLEYEQQALEREPHGFFGGITDIVRRTGYFSAGFFDELAKNGFNNFGDALMVGLAEAVDPQMRPEFKDVVKHVAPEMPDWAASVLGFAGDVTLDPLNALSLGSLGSVKIFGRPLSKIGAKLYGKEIGDAVEAAGWGLKKAEVLTEMAKVTDRTGKVFIRQMIGDTVDKLGPEVIGHVPNSDLLPTVMRGFGIPVDEVYAKGLAEADDVAEVITRNHGEGTTAKIYNYLNDLRNHDVPGEKLIADFGRDVAEPVMAHLDQRGSAIMELADKVKAGVAHPTEARAAFELVKKFAAVDPLAVEKFQKRFPEMAKMAGSIEELGQAAYREAEDTAAKKIAELAGMNVDTKELPKHELFDQGGIKIFGKSVVSSRVFDRISQITRLDKLKNKLGEVKIVQGLAGAFNRNFKLPEEYLKIRQDLERSLQSIENINLRDASEIFSGVTKDERSILGKAGTDIDQGIVAFKQQKTEAALDAWKLANPKVTEITPQILKSLEQDVTGPERLAIIEDMMNKYKIKENPKLFASFGKLMHGLNEIGMKNFQTGLTEEMSTQFMPLIHEIIADPTLFNVFQKTKLTEGLGAHQAFVEKGFRSIEEAMAAGYQPEMDALTLYMNRALASKEAIAKKNFRDVIKIQYKTDNIKSLPAHIRRDINFIGDSKMPAGWSDFTKAGLTLYDKVQGFFKKWATSVRPSFGARQVFSNSLQQYLALGPEIMHNLDPRSSMDAMAAVMHHYGAIGDTAKWLDGSVIQSPFGHKITGREFAAKLQQWGVIRGQSIAGGAYERDAAKSMEAAIKNFDWNDQSRSGLKKLWQLGVKYTQLPGYIEDIARTTLFGNALRMGYDDRAALNLVNKTLFDYQNGLSRFGRQIGQRLFPFFSYTNFALPFVTRISMTHPNRIANLDRFVEGFFGAMNGLFGGAHLNPSERAALPGFLLEQSNYLESLSPEGKAKFRTFNNFSPLDVMGGFQQDAKGEIDFRKTFIQNIMSQVAPAIKIPIEVLVKRNFFTGQAIGGKKDIGKQDLQTLLGNMAGMVAAGQKENVVTGLAFKYGIQYAPTPEIVQEGLKKLMGWEDGIDHRTGKETTYVNAWMLYALTNLIPALGQAVRVSDINHTPNDKWLDFIGGIGSLEQDIPRNVQIRIDEQNRQVRDLKYQMHAALRDERMNDYDQRLAELEQLLQTIAEKRATLGAFPITGQ